MKRIFPLMVVLAGCANVPDDSRPSAALPAQFASAPPSQFTAILRPDWWALFDDSNLTVLVEAALKNNADVRLAASRVEETAAVLGITRSANWPQVDLGGAITRSRASTLNGQPLAPGGAESTTHRLALSTSFEIDLWGKLRNANAAAQAQLLSTQYAQDAVQLALAASTAQAYFGLRVLDAQLALNMATQTSREESLKLVDKRATAGLASPLEAAQARAALASVTAQRPELQRQRSLLENQLGVLTAQAGLKVAVSNKLPAPANPPAGLPSALLERRPDVRQAEAQLQAARAQVQVARAALWPTLSLSGSFGGQSAELVDLLKSGARIWSIGPSLLLPLIDGGRNAARTEQARAQAEQSAIGYQKAVQAAFRDVADALAGTEQGAAQEAETDKQRSAAAEVLRIAMRRHEAGYAGYLEVLDAQRSVQDADLALLRTRALRLDASVALIKALGGGWVAQKP